MQCNLIETAKNSGRQIYTSSSSSSAFSISSHYFGFGSYSYSSSSSSFFSTFSFAQFFPIFQLILMMHFFCNIQPLFVVCCCNLALLLILQLLLLLHCLSSSLMSFSSYWSSSILQFLLLTSSFAPINIRLLFLLRHSSLRRLRPNSPRYLS